MANRVGQQLGNYRLLRELGRGNFAEVYLAEHLYLERSAAIKVLHVQMDPETQERFLREARTIARLQHPHIIQVLDFGLDEQTPYLVMQYTPGGTLREHYPKGTRLAVEQIVTYLKQIALALDYAHQQRVIHRDIKPHNLLLTANHEVVLGDFGLAVMQRSLDALSMSNPSAGTPLYMAPEQIQYRPCAASDQYALGVMVYEWLAGEPPFDGKTVFEVFSHHLYQAPPSLRERLPDLPAAVEAVVFRALAKDPEQRFACVADFASAFEEACEATQRLTPHAMSAPPSPTQNSSNAYDVPSQSPYPVNPNEVLPPPPLSPRRVSPMILGMPVVLLLLIIGASIGFVLLRNNQARTTITPTMTAPNTSNTGNATATASAFQNVYYTIMNSSIPVYDDPLSDNTQGMQWSQGQGCTFTGAGYHITQTQSGTFQPCWANKSNVSNCVYQVQMTITKGNYGGLIFRADSSFTNYYIFRVGQDGVYSFALYKNNVNTEVQHGPSPTFKQGPGQTNLITIIAQGAYLTFYVNSQYVYNTTDSSFSSGKIGLVAGSIGSPAEVVYNNAKLWTL